MAFSALKQCRSSMQTSLTTRNLASSTTPKFATSTLTGSTMHQQGSKGQLRSLATTLKPIWPVLAVMGGMVGVVCSIGVHTAKQQLRHSPSVQVTKKKRECIPEVDNPDAVIQSSDKFINKSFLRKVGHIQDKHNHRAGPDPFTRSREVETLNSVHLSRSDLIE